MKREMNIDLSSSSYESRESSMVAGIARLLGMERMITGGLSFFIEYAFYNCEKTENTKVDAVIASVPYTYDQLERLGLPRQVMRFGLSYNF